MADIDRQKLRAILLDQTTSELQRIWADTLENRRELMVDEIMQYGDFELTQALRRHNWDFHVKG
jgi:hypothetical protein